MSILSDTRILMPTCFLVPFDWNNFIQPFTLRQFIFLKLRYVSCRQRIGGVYFLIHSVSLCLGELRPLMFKVITEICVNSSHCGVEFLCCFLSDTLYFNHMASYFSPRSLCYAHFLL